MDKNILNDYIDACELVKETEDDIRRLKKRRKTIVQDSVKGSMSEFPYAAQNFHIEGLSYVELQNPENLNEEEQLLEKRKEQAATIKIQVEAWMNTIPMHVQRIIRYKIFKGMKWDEVAVKMNGGKSGDAYRKQLEDFLKEK